MSLDWKTITSLEKSGELDSLEDLAPRSSYEAERVLFLSDIHIPFEDKKVLRQVLELIKQDSFDRIVINGDLLDFYDISRFVSHQYVPIEHEIEEAKIFFAKIRALFDGPIDYTIGNHEERLELYIRTDATKLSGLKVLELGNLLDLEAFNVTLHQKEGFLLRPHFLVYHGTIVRKHSGYSAKGELEKHGISGISGHTHRLDGHHVTDRRGIRGWREQGCLCRVDAEYITGVPNWRQGFCIGEFAHDSDWFTIEDVPIIDRVLRYRGHDYSSGG